MHLSKIWKNRGKYKRQKLLIIFPPTDNYFDLYPLVLVCVRMWIFKEPWFSARDLVYVDISLHTQ